MAGVVALQGLYKGLWAIFYYVGQLWGFCGVLWACLVGHINDHIVCAYALGYFAWWHAAFAEVNDSAKNTGILIIKYARASFAASLG